MSVDTALQRLLGAVVCHAHKSRLLNATPRPPRPATDTASRIQRLELTFTATYIPPHTRTAH